MPRYNTSQMSTAQHIKHRIPHHNITRHDVSKDNTSPRKIQQPDRTLYTTAYWITPTQQHTTHYRIIHNTTPHPHYNSTIQQHPIQYTTICHTMTPRNDTSCRSTPQYAPSYHTMAYHITPQHATPQQITTQYGIQHHNTTQHGTLQQNTAQHTIPYHKQNHASYDHTMHCNIIQHANDHTIVQRTM